MKHEYTFEYSYQPCYDMHPKFKVFRDGLVIKDSDNLEQWERYKYPTSLELAMWCERESKVNVYKKCRGCRHLVPDVGCTVDPPKEVITHITKIPFDGSLINNTIVRFPQAYECDAACGRYEKGEVNG